MANCCRPRYQPRLRLSAHSRDDPPRIHRWARRRRRRLASFRRAGGHASLITRTGTNPSVLFGVGVTGLFLGHYLPWDGISNTLIAQANGFVTLDHTVEGSMVNYENLDNHQTGIHDYFKFLKFGFSRATDISCLHMRRGRITRQDAVEIVKRNDGKFPWKYLDKPLEDILEPLEMSVDEFIKICDKFTNKKIFKCDAGGKLVKDRHGNLEKLNYDNV